MENMENFICSSESCVELVQEGLTRSTKELYDIIGRGIATSIERVVRDRFFQSNFYYRVFFASTFWTKLQNIFGHYCKSKLEKVAKPRLAAILPAA